MGPQTHWRPQLIGQQGGLHVWAGGGAMGRSQQRRTPWDSGWPRGGETRKGEGHLGDGVTRTGDPEEQQQLGAGLPRGSPAPPPLLVWTHLLPAPQLVPRAPLPSLCPPETVAESCPNPTSNPRCEPPLTGTSPPSCSQREKPCFLSAPTALPTEILPKPTITFTHFQARATTMAQLTVLHARAEHPGACENSSPRTEVGETLQDQASDPRWGRRELGVGGSP